MELQIDEQELQKVKQEYTGTYATFRENIPKPPEEDAHLRHIFRFYIARSLLQHGEENVFILPAMRAGEKIFRPDVVAKAHDKYYVALCEPGSVTQSTKEILDILKNCNNVEVFIIHSQFGDSSIVTTQFQEQLQSRKFRLLAVVPPPFDDAYEYDIWMFELTFRDLFSGE